MMEQFSLDPYEQQLLKVFDGHDRENSGSLDKEGLTQLCQTLQLEEQGTDLIKCLLKDKKSRATFTEFKDALLALLGNMQNNKNVINEEDQSKDIEKASPDREVSPKFVYGSKKYGRRSRPRNDETNTIFDAEQNDINLINKSPNNTSVQRSNSQTEVSNSKKRKTNYKLKRCTSLPGNNSFNNERGYDNSFITSSLTSEPELVCTEEMLREAWKKLGVGEDGYLNQNELILVFEQIGLHKLAEGVIRQLSDKLTLNYDHKISFQELLEALQQDETWFDLLNTSPRNNNDLKMPSENLFPDSRTFQYVTLGPDGNGIINAEVLIEMWESVGIHSPKELVHELGFNSRRINIIELAAVLEKQIKGLNEGSRTECQNPHIALLQANLTLYQSEIRCFKNVLEQMHAEREKLKCDVLDANNRATLLAQEVDDNHLRMEQNTVNQVKLLEHRHADILREVQAQFCKDKEQLGVINQSLEDRIILLEVETVKLKNDLIMAQKYSINLEKENLGLTGKITDLQRDKEMLTGKIGLLQNEKQSRSEREYEENEILLEKLKELQLENSQLKDKSDEMVSEIESLASQIASMRNKVSSTPTVHSLDQSMEENISIICEGVGIGAKRRSDCSPNKDGNFFGISDGSPRLGKVRKFNKIKGENLEVPFTSSESGFDTEIDCFDSSLSASINDSEEITKLRARTAFLEQILKQNCIPIPPEYELESETNASLNALLLTNRIKELEKIIANIKTEMKTMIDKDCINCDVLKNISEQLENILLEDKEGYNDDTLEKIKKTDASQQTDFFTCLEEKINKLEETNSELTTKCSELENCIELLRNEYEKCEDYWQTKVEDERQIFEMEQKQNSERLNDLILKMKEYEEQYNTQDAVDNRLPPIEETYNLEKQFTDLEQEYEDYKSQSEAEIFQKNEEITLLKEKLTELALKQRQMAEASVQAEELEETKLLNKMKNFGVYVAENTNKYPDEMSPPNRGAPVLASSQTNSLPLNWDFTNNAKISTTPLSTVPSTSSSSTCLKENTTPCRPKRTRKRDNMYKKNNQEKEVKKTEHHSYQSSDWKGFNAPAYKSDQEQSVSIPLATLHNLNRKKNFLEQRVKHLQYCLSRQNYFNEQTLQCYWQHFNGEKADLQYKLRLFQEKFEQQKRINAEQSDKLERCDLLVKDLYVENAYLIASVQRLEQQCHMLAQCSNSSSV